VETGTEDGIVIAGVDATVDATGELDASLDAEAADGCAAAIAPCSCDNKSSGERVGED